MINLKINGEEALILINALEGLKSESDLDSETLLEISDIQDRIEFNYYFKNGKVVRVK